MSKPEHSFAPDAGSEPTDAPHLPITKNRGWTPHKQAAFLHALCSTHNVARAARSVGMSRQSAYALRARLSCQPFDHAWDAVFARRFDLLAEVAMNRALNGVEVPHLHNGEVVHVSRRYDEKLTLGLLKMRADLLQPEPLSYEPAGVYGADDLAHLIARVAEGPERWQRTADGELEAFAKREPPTGEGGYYPETEIVDEDEEYGDEFIGGDRDRASVVKHRQKR